MSEIQRIPRELELLQKAGQYLAECQSLGEVKQLRDKAEALRFYQQKIDKSGQSAIIAAEIKVRAERRMGELLREMPKNKGAASERGNNVLPRLDDLGIPKMESHRCQAIAALPEKEFEETIEQAKKSRRPPTSNEVKVKGQSYQRRKAKHEELNGKAESNGEAIATWEIRHGDCVEALASLPERSARLVFADPPYNIGINYGKHYNDSRPADEYDAFTVDWINEVYRVLSPDGSLWLLIGHEWARQVSLRAEEVGLHLRQWITWYESFGVNTTRMFNRCSRVLLWLIKSHHQFVFNDCDAIRRKSDRQTKYNDPRANPEGKLWDDVWGIHEPIPRVVGTSKERLPDFPTQLPLALLRPIIACASNPGDLVIDPFSGSGTCGAACIELGRQFIGIELSKEYAALSRKRLAATSKEAK